MDLKASIRAIPDYPKPGIMFRDLTTLMADSKAFRYACGALAEAVGGRGLTHVAGIEARGFIFGAAVADRMGLSFVPIRKKGKLPADTITRSYALEYGEDTLEVHKGVFTEGARVLLLDDLLATGGTAAASAELIREAGGSVELAAFVVELAGLAGRQRLGALGVETCALVTYQDD